MAFESSDPITAALIETEKEVAGFAWGNEDTEAADPTGDQSLEDMGEGLEGQHEAEEDEDAQGDTEGGEDSDAEGEGKGKGEDLTKDKPATAKEGDGDKPDAITKPAAREPEGRIPPGRLREANEARRAAEAERDAFKANFEKSQAESAAKFDLVMRELAALKTAPRTTEAPKTIDPPKPEEVPDIFESPKGFVDHIVNQIRSEVAGVRQDVERVGVVNSFRVAHVRHGEAFPKAMEAINKLDTSNPDDRATVQRIYKSPDPGEALVSWYKRNQTLAEVGDDPVAYRERVAKETREALLKDPEFRKQLVADMRGEAVSGDHGAPRTITRLPKSLNGAPGSNVGTSRNDPTEQDGSQQSIADAAWR